MPLGEANSPGSIRRNQKSQLKTNRHADSPVLIPSHDRLLPECGFVLGDHPSGISVSLQVEYKQFIGNVHVLGSSLR